MTEPLVTVEETVTMLDIVNLLQRRRDAERAHKIRTRRAKNRGRSAGHWLANRLVGWIDAESCVAVYGQEKGRQMAEDKIAQHMRDLPAFAPGYARTVRAELAGLRAYLRGEPKP